MQTKLQASGSLERSAREECVNIRSKLADIEGQLSTARHEAEMTKMQLEQLKTERQISEQDLQRYIFKTRLIICVINIINVVFISKIDSLSETIKKQNETIQVKEKEINNLRQQLTMEKFSVEMDGKQQSISHPLVKVIV